MIYFTELPTFKIQFSDKPSSNYLLTGLEAAFARSGSTVAVPELSDILKSLLNL
jgi:hypothetical protein